MTLHSVISLLSLFNSSFATLVIKSGNPLNVLFSVNDKKKFLLLWKNTAFVMVINYKSGFLATFFCNFNIE